MGFMREVMWEEWRERSRWARGHGKWCHRSGAPQDPSRPTTHDAVLAQAFANTDRVPLRLVHQTLACGRYTAYAVGVSTVPFNDAMAQARTTLTDWMFVVPAETTV